MSRRFRWGLGLLGVAVLALAAGFFLQASWATAIWPVPAGPLSHIFTASIMAAIAAPSIWLAVTGERRAIAPGAIDLALTNAGITVAGLWFYVATGSQGLLLFAMISLVLVVVFLRLFAYGHAASFHDRRPTPQLVRIAFACFALLLFLVATALVTVRPNVFPWPISAENSVIYGFIFYGAMIYFAYGLLYPVWGNACGQLLGFLAYDLVLIVPFLRHFDVVAPEKRASLIIYTSVLVVSGLLALWFLFLDPRTRFGGEPLRRSGARP